MMKMALSHTINILFLLSILIKFSNANNRPNYSEYVVTVQDSEEGVKVTLVPSTMDQAATFETKIIRGHRLSPDCGRGHFRCQPLIFTTNNSNNNIESLVSEHIVFVPLQNGLLLLNFSDSLDQNSAQLELRSSHLLSSTHCSPTTVFKIYNSFYTMCTDLQNQYISLYEVQLNSTSIQQSRMYGPLTELSSVDLVGFSSSDVANMSDFLIDLDIPNQPLIYFGIDNYLITINPIDWLFYDEFNLLGVSCRHVKRLIKASTSRLLAYCLEGYVYYDVVLQGWTSEQTYASSGVPHLCPDHNYAVSIHDSYIEYRVGSRTGTISDVHFDNGLCFAGSLDNATTFVYADKATNSVNFVNLTSGGQMLSTSLAGALTVECSTVDCIPIMYLSERYLVIQQAGGDETITVLDVDSEFRTVVSLDHQAPSLVVILQGKALSHDLSTVPPSNVVIGGKVSYSLRTVLSVTITLMLLALTSVLTVVIIIRWKGMRLCSTRHIQCADIESNRPDSPPVHYNYVYPQQEQDLATTLPESDKGREENRMLQPFTNNGCRGSLEEGKIEKVIDDKRAEPEIPSHFLVISGPSMIQHSEESYSPSAENDVNDASDRAPLLN